jgi:CheY-like chemotaxis protein
VPVTRSNRLCSGDCSMAGITIPSQPVMGRPTYETSATPPISNSWSRSESHTCEDSDTLSDNIKQLSENEVHLRLGLLPGYSHLSMIRILLVDDNEMVRESIKKILEEEPNWTVCCEATEGAGAVEKALHEKPDLLVIDMSMPNMGGLEATKQIRRWLSDVKIVILTFHDSPEILAQAKQAGADTCLVKTDSPENIRRTIVELLQNK